MPNLKSIQCRKLGIDRIVQCPGMLCPECSFAYSMSMRANTDPATAPKAVRLTRLDTKLAPALSESDAEVAAAAVWSRA